MLQKTATAKKANTNPAIHSGNADARAAAKKAKALLRGIRPASLKQVRNKILTDAIKLFQTKGWVQYSLHNNDGFCAIGAVQHVKGPKPAKDAAVKALHASLPRNERWDTDEAYNFPLGSAVVSYNDEIAERRSDVTRLFQKAKKVKLRKDN